MPPVTRGFSSSLLVPGLRQIYVETGKEVPLDFEQVINVSDMEWNPITDGQYTGLGTMPEKPEGSQFRTDRPIAGGTKVSMPQGAGADQISTSQVADVFARSVGSAPQSFSATKRLGSSASRISQITDGKWKVMSEYVSDAPAKK